MWSLLTWLPAEAAVWQGEPASWTMEQELAAVNAELLHSLIRLQMRAHGAKRGSIPKQLEVPRPHRPRGARPSSHAGLAAIYSLGRPGG